MKDGFMFLVLLAVIMTPMFPVLLKSKCPGCGKRKLENLETEKNGKTFVTFYRCHNCQQHYQQEKSGPLKEIAPRQAKPESELISA